MKRFEKPILVTRPNLPTIGFYTMGTVPMAFEGGYTYCNMCRAAQEMMVGED